MRRLSTLAGLAVISSLMLPGNTHAAPAPSPSGVSFIHDDYPAALHQARAAKLPLFAKIWSPW